MRLFASHFKLRLPRPRFSKLFCLVLVGAAGFGAHRSAAERVEITLLQTTDIHAFLVRSDRLPAGGGWLRLGTLIREARRKWGRDHTLLIDCGDTCQGTLAGVATRGGIGPKLLRALDYDAWVPGNHDLDFGVWRLYELAQPLRERTLCANLELQIDADRVHYPAWRLFTRAGAKVAVIGATASRLKDWLWGRNEEGFSVEPAARAVARVLPHILAIHPDLVVLAIHQGWLPKDPRGINEVAGIARRFPEINLILGGHTHRDIPGRRIGSRTWYVQAGCHAARLGVVHVALDLAQHRVLDISSELVEAGADVPPDPQLSRLLAPEIKRIRAYAQRLVTRLPHPISARGTPGETCAASELLCRAIAAATGAEVVFQGKLSRIGLPAGRVTEQDLFNLVPYENDLAVARLKPPALRKIIEEQQAWRSSPAYCGVWGIQAFLDRSGRVLSLRDSTGQAAAPDRVFRVAFNSYTVAGAGRRFPVLRSLLRSPQAGLRDTGINTRDAVRAYLQAHPGLEIRPVRWLRRRRRRAMKER